MLANPHAGKLVEKAIMRKYGVENINDHFVSFNTICDATQVITVVGNIILIVAFNCFILCLFTKLKISLDDLLYSHEDHHLLELFALCKTAIQHYLFFLFFF